MTWWRRHWRWMLAVGTTLLAGVVLLVLMLLAQYKKAGKLSAQLALRRAAAKVAGLEADKAAHVLELALNERRADKVDKEIADAKRAAVATVEKVDGMSDKQIEAEFNRLGY